MKMKKMVTRGAALVAMLAALAGCGGNTITAQQAITDTANDAQAAADAAARARGTGILTTQGEEMTGTAATLAQIANQAGDLPAGAVKDRLDAVRARVDEIKKNIALQLAAVQGGAVTFIDYSTSVKQASADTASVAADVIAYLHDLQAANQAVITDLQKDVQDLQNQVNTLTNTPPPAPVPAVALAASSGGPGITRVSGSVPAGVTDTIYYTLTADDGGVATATLSAPSATPSSDGTFAVDIKENGSIGRTYTFTASTVAPSSGTVASAVADFLVAPAQAATYSGTVKITTSVQRWSKTVSNYSPASTTQKVSAPVAAGGISCSVALERQIDMPMASWMRLTCRDTTSGNVVSDTLDTTRTGGVAAMDATGLYVAGSGVGGTVIDKRDPTTQAVAWTTPSALPAVTGLALSADGTTLFAVAQNNIYAISTSTGEVVSSIPETSFSMTRIDTAPDGSYCIAGTKTDSSSVPSTGYTVVQRRSSIGQVVWQKQIDPKAMPATTAPFAVAATTDGCYVATQHTGVFPASSDVYKLSAADGTVPTGWPKTLTTAFAQISGADTGLYVVTASGLVQKWDLSGNVIWSTTLSSAYTSTTPDIRIVGNQVYIVTGSNPISVSRLDDM